MNVGLVEFALGKWEYNHKFGKHYSRVDFNGITCSSDCRQKIFAKPLAYVLCDFLTGQRNTIF